MRYSLSLIGFGTVTRGFCRMLLDQAQPLRETHDVSAQVVAIATRSRGVLLNPEGIDLADALQRYEREGSLKSHPDAVEGWDALRVIREAEADVVVENTPTDVERGEPARSHVREALEARKHVITANKGPLVVAFRELVETARERGVQLLYEGTVCSATPTFSLRDYGLAGTRVHAFEGILNSTTNYMLARMEAGMGYDEALQQAQELGYAEADPTGDVEGWDAAAKVVILANALLGADLKLKDVERAGITDVTPDDIRRAKDEGRRIKLIGRGAREGTRVRASVAPTPVPLDHPFATAGASVNALRLHTDVLEHVTVLAEGASGPKTGYAILSDLLELRRRLW